MKEKTFAVSYNNSDAHYVPRFNYIFSWDDGEVKTFIVVSLHAALALGKHFTSFGYQDMVHIAPTDHEYVELNYRKDHEERLRLADMADYREDGYLVPPLAD